MHLTFPAPEQSNRFIFPFNPQTWVRTTQNARVIFRIPEAQLQIASLRYKKRLIKYSEYKETLHAYAKQHNFDLKVSGTALYFFIPMPKRWNKTEKAKFNMMEHHRKPDLSNLLKAFEDALLPKKDESISGYSGLKKFWVDAPDGWIELHLNIPQYNPISGMYEVMDTQAAFNFNQKL